MSHRCHATACTKNVPPQMFSCRPHWFGLPKSYRDAIWQTYRAGQCDDMNPSREYCLAAKAAVIYLSKKDGVEPDTHLYDLFLARSTRQAPESSNA